jgi:hypothetical protein
MQLNRESKIGELRLNLSKAPWFESLRPRGACGIDIIRHMHYVAVTSIEGGSHENQAAD